MVISAERPAVSSPANNVAAMNLSLIRDRDYSVILGRSRRSYDVPDLDEDWQSAERTIQPLMQLCETLDRDGITLYSGTPTGPVRHDHVTATTLPEILKRHCPPHELHLAGPLQAAIDDYFSRKSAGLSAANGAIIVILIDGEPEDRRAIVRSIVAATRQMERDEELGIGIVQIGEDSIATGFFNALDEDLHHGGARFDIVHSCSSQSLASENLVEFLANVIRL